jgi:hypothetical protein
MLSREYLFIKFAVLKQRKKTPLLTTEIVPISEPEQVQTTKIFNF